MARFGCNFWVNRPMPQPDHVWAIAHDRTGRHQMGWMPRAKTAQTMEEATALIVSGQTAWCGRELWDRVYAWWEEQETATGAVPSAPVLAATAINALANERIAHHEHAHNAIG